MQTPFTVTCTFEAAHVSRAACHIAVYCTVSSEPNQFNWLHGHLEYVHSMSADACLPILMRCGLVCVNQQLDLQTGRRIGEQKRCVRGSEPAFASVVTSRVRALSTLWCCGMGQKGICSPHMLA